MNLALSIELFCSGTSEGANKAWDERGRKYNRRGNNSLEAIENRLKEVGKEVSVAEYMKSFGTRTASSAVVSPSGKIFALKSYHDTSLIDMNQTEMMDKGYIKVNNFGGGKSLGIEIKSNSLNSYQEEVLFDMIGRVHDKEKVSFDLEHLKSERFASGSGADKFIEALDKVFPVGHDKEDHETDEFGQPL